MSQPDFAGLLVEARGKRGLTQAQLAQAAGLTPSYLSFIENRKKPPPSDEVCTRLAEVLGLAPRRLIEIAHLERAPEPLRKRMRTLDTSLRRERSTRKRLLRSLLSPFLFAGPAGYLEGALDAVSISPKRKKRIRQVLDAVGRKRMDREAEVSKLVEELPDRERTALLEALPGLLEEKDAAAAAGDAAPNAPEPEPAPSPAAETPAEAPIEPVLLYAPPDRGRTQPYLLQATAAMAAGHEAIAAGDRLVVDPRLTAQDGDLFVFRSGDGAGLLRRVAADDATVRLQGGSASAEDLRHDEFRRRVAETGAGAVVEVRRPLRRGRA